MPHIDTLIVDIQHLLKQKGGWFSPEISKEFAHEVETRLSAQFNKEEKAPTLRLSQMGSRCPCALWHSIHAPDEAEPLPPWAEFKYAYGAIIEALAVALAKAAGHDVRGEQDRVVVDGIVGHRDCVIDGCVVDVKSAASRSFQKFRDGSIRLDDSFGYLDQLDGYLVGSADDPIVTVKDKGYLLVIDKQLGHMVLYEHTIRPDGIKSRIKDYKRIVAQDRPPACTCGTVPDGKSGNIRLDTKASYNSFKYCCNPSLRTFLYSDGPRYLTKVMRKPDVTEIDRYGKVVYMP
jgi:hypothetical protein